MPGGVRTNASVATGMRADTLFVFATTPDGRILFDREAPGHDFDGWRSMAGGVVTNVALGAAGRPGDDLFVFATTPDGRIPLQPVAARAALVGWQEVPGGVRTNASVAAGMRADTLFVFTTTPDGRIRFNQSLLGHDFDGWRDMAGDVVTNVALGAAGRPGDDLFVLPRRRTGASFSTSRRPAAPSSAGKRCPAVSALTHPSPGRAGDDTIRLRHDAGRAHPHQREAPGHDFVDWQIYSP